MPTVAPLDLDGHCIAACWLSDIPHFALADGTVHRLDNGHKTAAVHDGLLCAVPTLDGKALLTGGEDGRVCAVAPDGTATELGNIGRKWVTAVAAGPRNAVAFASGRVAHVILPDGARKEIAHPRSVEGLAFAPKGLRLAVARYNGATLHFPAAEGKPAELEWAGAHTGVTFSPDGNFLVTTMQENALHGWKLTDGKHMRMAGYPAKVKSLSWSAKRAVAGELRRAGRHRLAVPVEGRADRQGPGRARHARRRHGHLRRLPHHRRDPRHRLCRRHGARRPRRRRQEVLLRRPGKGAVTAMSWDGEGRRIAFGTEAGDCGVIDVAG